MKFAQARELITPSIRTTMSGYASRPGEFKGIHDDLYIKSALMENDGNKLLIMTFDLCHYTYDLNERIMEYAKDKYQIPNENFIINYAHTHAGPKITSPTERQDPSPLDSFFLERAKTCLDRTFLNVFDGSLQIATTSGRWNINRRLKTENGYVMKPNYTAQTDDEVIILIVRDSENNICSIFINYSCHPVTLSGTLFLSSEFPGRLCNILESKYYGATAFFLQGAAGNMRPLITADKGNFKACSFSELDEFSTAISEQIVKTIHSGNFEAITPTLQGINFSIDLPIDTKPLEFFKSKLDNSSGYVSRGLKKVIDDYETIDDFATIHCGIIKLNDALYIAYMGGEIVIEIKQIVREVFNHSKVVFLGYHEALTYIPDDKILMEGGYEGFDAPTNAGFKGPFKKGINKVIADAFSSNLKKLN